MIIGDHEFFDLKIPEEAEKFQMLLKFGAPLRCLERRHFDAWVRHGGQCNYGWYLLAWGLQNPSEEFIYTISESRYLDE